VHSDGDGNGRSNVDDDDGGDDDDDDGGEEGDHKLQKDA
jgi:hypothetical protein